MQAILQNPFFHKFLFSLLAGVATFLAFPKWGFWPCIYLVPLLLNLVTMRTKSFKEGFAWGFLTSAVIMVGGFYWVVHVIHEFGHYSYPVAGLLFLAFCGFGALNFPLYQGLATLFHRKIKIHAQPKQFIYLWYALALPALFTMVEFVVPKLFPWSLGHSLYSKLPLIQVVELTGVTFLSFAIFSLSSVSGLLLSLLLPSDDHILTEQEEQEIQTLKKGELLRPRVSFFLLPGTFWVLILVFGYYKLTQRNSSQIGLESLRVAVVQANIGTLEKVQAEKGNGNRQETVLKKYERLTNQLLGEVGRPELIVWPETAMPFYPAGNQRLPGELRSLIYQWNIPVITGGHAPHPGFPFLVYNAAFLLDPQEDGTIRTEQYEKNILLAFGEYLPLGQTFPILYKWIPSVGQFFPGTEQKIFSLAEKDLKVGATICYEAIRPSYTRKVLAQGVHLLVNLTNDSWFGNTSEPYQHAALALFRAVEGRLPLIRATNTGMSLAVDAYGVPLARTGIYREDYLMTEVWFPKNPTSTFYVVFGDWFVMVCLILMVVIYRKRRLHAPISS